METKIVMDSYPVLIKNFNKDEISLKSVQEFLNYFIEKIESDPMAKFISIFDHYTHTTQLGGEIDDSIKDAKNLIFCFGPKILKPISVALRPRSLGIVDLGKIIQVNFMAPPAEPIKNKMVAWVQAIK